MNKSELINGGVNFKKNLVYALYAILSCFAILSSSANASENCANYISIREYQVTDSDEIGRRVQEGFFPIVKNINGFVGYYIVAVSKTKTISISMFSTREGAEESAVKGKLWSKGAVSDISSQPPVVNNGEVIATTCR